MTPRPDRPRLLRCTFALAAIGALATDAFGNTYQNEKVGYGIDLPKAFAGSVERKQPLRDFLIELDDFLVDRFYADDRLKTKKGASFQPTLDVYFFPTREAAEAAASSPRQRELYLHFEDYAKKKFKGFYFDDVEPLGIGPYDAVLSVMRYEKLAGKVPRSSHVCAIAAPGGELAVVFTCPTERFKSRRSMRLRAFRSVRVIDESAGLRSVEKPLLDALEAKLKEEKERAARETPTITVPVVPIPNRPDPDDFASLREAGFERAIAEAGSEWRSHRSEPILFLFRTPAKTVKSAKRHVGSLSAYLDQAFGGFGDGLVQGAVVKVGVSARSRDAGYSLGQVRTFWIGYNDSAKTLSFYNLNRDLAESWFRQRNEIAWRAMPSWIAEPLIESFFHVRLKGSRLTWEPAKKKAKKKTKPETADIIPFDRLIGEESEELAKDSQGRAQAKSMVSYLHWGPGARARLTKGLLSRYVEACGAASMEAHRQRVARATAMKAVLDKEVDTLTAEELLEREDVLYRLKQGALEVGLKQAVADLVFQELFADWTDADWRQLERDWLKWERKR